MYVAGTAGTLVGFVDFTLPGNSGHTMYDNVPAIGLYTRHAFRYLGTSITLRKPL